MLASFEKTTDHLFEGAFYSKRDPVNGISERIILGQPANHIGTSLAQLVSPKPIFRGERELFFEVRWPQLILAGTCR
jgi:DNA-directed RNA polymerase III subunit RPC1